MEWVRTTKKRQFYCLFLDGGDPMADIVGQVVGVTLNGKTTWHASAWVRADSDGIDTNIGEFLKKQQAFDAVEEVCLTKN